MESVQWVKYISEYKLELTFTDGLTGIVDLESELYGEVFEPLKNIEELRKVIADRELSTIVWPNGADFAPEFLYDLVLNSGGHILSKTGT